MPPIPTPAPAPAPSIRIARSKSAGSIQRSHGAHARARPNQPLNRVPSTAAPVPALVNRTQHARSKHQQQLARSRSVGNVSRKQSRAHVYPPATAGGRAAAVGGLPSTRRATEHIKPMALLSDVGAGAPIAAAPQRRLGFFRKNAAPAPSPVAADAAANTPAPRFFGGLFTKKPLAAQPQPTTSIPSQSSQPIRKPIVRFADSPAAGGPGVRSSPRTHPRAGSQALVARNAANRSRGPPGGGSNSMVVYRAGAGASARMRGRRPGSMARYGRAGYASSGGRMTRTMQYGARGPNGAMVRRMAIGGSAIMPMGIGPPGGGGGGGGGVGIAGISGSIDGKIVVLDGTSLTQDCEGPGEGPLILITALSYYALRGVDVFIIIQEELADDWEMDLDEPGLDSIAANFAQLRASDKMFTTPRRSNYRLFLLRAGIEFQADIVSNDSESFEEVAMIQEDPTEVEMYLEERLIPFMLIRGKFIPHPEEARLVSGLHSPAPPAPPPVSGFNGNPALGQPGSRIRPAIAPMKLRMPSASNAVVPIRYRNARNGTGIAPRYNARLAQRGTAGIAGRRFSSSGGLPRRSVRYNAASGYSPVPRPSSDPRLRAYRQLNAVNAFN